MSETRKLAAILVTDVVGYSRLAGADEDRTLARLRGLRSDLIDPAIAAHHGRIVKRTGDGTIVEFRSVVDAVRCAIEVQNGLIERNAGLPPEKRIEFRVGVHVGDVVEESDGDLMGDGVNIAARLEGIAKPGAICLSEDAYRQVQQRLDLKVTDLGATQLKNIAEPIRVYSLQVGAASRGETAERKQPLARAARARGRGAAILLAASAWYLLGQPRTAARDCARRRRTPPRPPRPRISPSSCCPSPTSPAILPRTISPTASPKTSRPISRASATASSSRATPPSPTRARAVDAKEIGKELGVRYVLEGSVQRDQNRVRVNAQLIDAESGAHLWAERFEEDVADLFKLQDQVVARLGNALGFELVKAEAEKSARSNNPDAIDLAMRGWAAMWQSYPEPPKEKRDSHYAALALFDQALKIDPNDADALAGEAFTHMALFTFGEATTETNLDAKIIDQADRAIALAPDNMRAYAAKSFYLADTGRANEALRAADAGLAIDPNNAPLLDARTLAEISLGRFEQAKSDAQQGDAVESARS